MAIRFRVADRLRAPAHLKQRSRWRAWLLIGLLLVELFGLAWLLSLPRIFSSRRRRPGACACSPCRRRVVAFLTQEPLTSNPHVCLPIAFPRSNFAVLATDETSFDAEQGRTEVSVVVWRHRPQTHIREGGEAAAFTEATAKFIREAAAHFGGSRCYICKRRRRRRRGRFWISCRSTRNTYKKAARVVLYLIKTLANGTKIRTSRGQRGHPGWNRLRRD